MLHPPELVIAAADVAVAELPVHVPAVVAYVALVAVAAFPPMERLVAVPVSPVPAPM